MEDESKNRDTEKGGAKTDDALKKEKKFEWKDQMNERTNERANGRPKTLL